MRMDGTPKGPEADSVAVLAADLRRCRLAKGNPTLARLQSESGISRSVLSDAFSGRYLPSARTLDALVRVLGEDPAEWMPRRDTLARRKGSRTAAVEVASGANSARVTAGAEPVAPSIAPRPLLGLSFLTGVVVGVVASVAVVLLMRLT